MPVIDRESIAAEVRAEAGRRQMSQRDVAEILGMDQGSLNMRFTGKRAFRAEELAKLAKAWLIPIGRFYGELDANTTPPSTPPPSPPPTTPQPPGGPGRPGQPTPPNRADAEVAA